MSGASMRKTTRRLALSDQGCALTDLETETGTSAP
jgi:hypothetical protein